MTKHYMSNPTNISQNKISVQAGVEAIFQFNRTDVAVSFVSSWDYVAKVWMTKQIGTDGAAIAYKTIAVAKSAISAMVFAPIVEVATQSETERQAAIGAFAEHAEFIAASALEDGEEDSEETAPAIPAIVGAVLEMATRSNTWGASAAIMPTAELLAIIGNASTTTAAVRRVREHING